MILQLIFKQFLIFIILLSIFVLIKVIRLQQNCNKINNNGFLIYKCIYIKHCELLWLITNNHFEMYVILCFILKKF